MMSNQLPLIVTRRLDQYYEETGKEFYVQTHLGKIVKPWVLYPSGKRITRKRHCHLDKGYVYEEIVERVGFIGNENQRQILPHEIVIDIDAKLLNHAQNSMEVISSWLKKHELTHTVWFSGGKSYHVHLFFTELLSLNDNTRTAIKQNFLSIFRRLYPVDLQKAVTKTLIQMENTRHYKTGREKILIKKVTLNKPNKLPLAVKVVKHKTLTHTNHNTKNLSLCLTYLLQNQLFDCRERALFSLISNLKHKMKPTELLRTMLEWNTLQQYHFTEYNIERKIASALNSPRATSCNYHHELLNELGVRIPCQHTN